jgi:hypothetical protein
MNEMRAARYDAYGPPEVLGVRNVPVPGYSRGVSWSVSRPAASTGLTSRSAVGS